LICFSYLKSLTKNTQAKTYKSEFYFLISSLPFSFPIWVLQKLKLLLK